jgi:2-haloalkanoic acid dehalogenase type II
MFLRKLAAVVFDLDLTLCHYVLSTEEAIERALHESGFPADRLWPLEAVAQRYNSAWWESEESSWTSTDEMRREIWIRILQENEICDAQAAIRISDSYGAIRRDTGVRPYDGVSSLLADLRSQYRLGILTNGPSDIQWEKLRALDLPSIVNEIVVAGDVGIFKPDARVFHLLLDRLAVPARAALFVGDSYERDIVGAHEAGMRTAWICRNGAAPDSDVVPDVFLKDVSQLREVLL